MHPVLERANRALPFGSEAGPCPLNIRRSFLNFSFHLAHTPSTLYDHLMELTGYLAPEGFTAELTRELREAKINIEQEADRLIIAQGPAHDIGWAQNTWHDLKRIPIQSIGDGAKKLRELHALWAPYSVKHHRRAMLIQDKLPKVRQTKEIEFLSPLPDRQLGAWTLLEPDLILAGARTSSPFANGEVHFQESKEAPSRAYLKLWEFFTLHGARPKPGAQCLDLGACPGGWTWVLAQMGCKVTSVDKAALDERVLRMPGVRQLKRDAFTLKPEDVGPIDWLFSDIICYPKDLFELVEVWAKSGLCRNFACTIKFQGETDFSTLQKFQAWPGAKVRHLFHNKHELTWWLQAPTEAARA
jgi:23S rRNA (cytidine2498-2'-O)-methyltransferase